MPAKSKFYSRWFVIILLLCIGPLGFYNLWKSPEFSKKAKYIIMAVVIILTVVIIAACGTVYRLLLDTVQNQLMGFPP